MKKYLILFSITFLFWMQNIHAQTFTDENRADFIYDICKYITWPEEEKLTEFTIGLLVKEKNSHLRSAIQQMIDKNKTLHNLPIEVKEFSNINEITYVQVVYVNKISDFDIDKIFKQIEGKPILLASENYEFHKSMVNFIIVDGKKRFELNTDKLNKAGLTARDLFIGLAVKTKADWQNLYERTDVLLQKEKETVQNQKQLIAKQEKDIQNQLKQLEEQKKEIKIQQEEIFRQTQALKKLSHDISAKEQELLLKTKVLKKQQEAIHAQKTEILKQQQAILDQNKILDEKSEQINNKQQQIDEQNLTINSQLKAIEKQQLVLYFFVVVFLMFVILGYFIIRSYRIKKKANIALREKNAEISQQKEEIQSQNDMLAQRNEEILQQKEEIETQRDEIEEQRDEIIAQRDIVTVQKEEIMDSIHYASRIQRAILPPKIFIQAVMPEEYFILNKPRDIVSGDFYWVGKNNDDVVILAADCTGHGVPGAFMSMLGVSFLNEIINKKEISKASQVLNELREYVVRALHQTGKEGESKDGMDMALCILNTESHILQYAGANNPLYLIRDMGSQTNIQYNEAPFDLTQTMKKSVQNDSHELLDFKADKMPIGLYADDHESFSYYEIELENNNTFYIFSDGYADQFGGNTQEMRDKGGKKFKYKPFKKLLLDTHLEPLKNQKSILETNIEEWRGNLEQVDDILVIGVRI